MSATDYSNEPVKNKRHLTNNPADQYAAEHSMSLSEAQKELIAYTQNHSSAIMLGSADELQLLAMICRMLKAKRTLDIGVFTGYSALTIAQVLPEDGKVVALDVTNEYESVCRKYWKLGGVESKIDFRIAPALDSLNELIANGEENSFDYAFIDADKINYKHYYECALKLVKPGGVIAIDNTLWSGKVYMETYDDESTVALRELNEFVHKDDRVYQILLNLADGTTLCVKK